MPQQVTISAGFSDKVSANYNSQQYSVSLEMECSINGKTSEVRIIGRLVGNKIIPYYLYFGTQHARLTTIYLIVNHRIQIVYKQGVLRGF